MLSARTPIAGSFPLALCLCLIADLGVRRSIADEKTAFPEPHDTQAAREGATPPAAAVAAIRLPPGFRATLFASEPDVRQPIALATDHRGRLWVAENYTYAEQRTNFDARLRDRIVILEDVDGDGRFDKRTLFWDQARRLTSIEIGFGGVWAMSPPNLLFIPDRNKDDVPDQAPEVVLDGWNDDTVRHNIANGLRWGPDGWLYGRHGILASSHVGAPGASPDQRTGLNCSIWRYHPTRRTFEVVCHGTTNSWGMDWDEHGQLFFINTVIGHLWHSVPGSHYQRMYGEDFNPYLYELLPQSADHFHWDTAEVWSEIRSKGVTPGTNRAGGGHAHCGMMIYQGGLWPKQYHNTVFTVNLHGLRINNDRLARRGAGYVATHEPDFFITTDPWFRGSEVTASADGNMFVADWSDIGECHENDGVHRSTGRIYKISFDHSSASNAIWTPGRDLTTGDDATLVGWQLAGNEWVVRHARQILQERSAAGIDLSRVHDELRGMFVQPATERQKLRILWALYVSGGATETWLLEQLRNPSEHVRAWAVQLLCDDVQPSAAARAAFRKLAVQESSGLVLQFLASSLQRTPLEERCELAERIAAHADFAMDPALPLMVWYGLEPAVPHSPERAVALARVTPSAKIRQFIARRATVDIERQPSAVSSIVAAILATDLAADQLDFLNGMALALRGRRNAPAPAGWQSVVQRLVASESAQVASLTRELSVVFGDGRAVSELRQIASTAKADIESRRSAIRALTAAKVEGTVDLLQKLIGERDLQRDVIRGLASFNDERTPRLLIENFRRLDSVSRPEAISTLVSRSTYARAMLDAIAAGRLDRQLVTPFHIRQVQALGDAKLNQSISELWPELARVSTSKARRIEELREQLSPDVIAVADLKNGKLLFHRSCVNCHVLFGEGGKVGPDLTGSQRTNLAYLLENIVDPSATVAGNFRMSTVLVTDGRVINGIVTEKLERSLTVITPTDRIVLARDEIEEIRSANLSIMPDNQLDVLTREQVRDLIGYLMRGEQLAK
jgi:putative membrane-bound dehydrogenase-like protein